MTTKQSSILIFIFAIFSTLINADEHVRGSEKGDDILLFASSWPSDGMLLNGNWRVSQTRLSEQPTWDPLGKKSVPAPLSAAGAAKIAIAEIIKRFPTVDRWRITQVGLHSVKECAEAHSERTIDIDLPDRWFYFVSAKPTDKKHAASLRSQGSHLCAVILMDGSVVTPIISEASPHPPHNYRPR
jgi:hypothetical protein